MLGESRFHRRFNTLAAIIAAGVGVLALLLLPAAGQAPPKGPAGPKAGEWGATVIPPGPDSPPRTAPRTPEKAARPPAITPVPTVPKVATYRVTGTAITDRGETTRISIELSGQAVFTIFRTADPYRLIIDLPDVEFALPPGTGRQDQGLVTAFRYGLFAPGKSRLVADTKGPVRIAATEVTALASGEGVRVDIDLAAITPTEFKAEEIAAAASGLDIAKEINPPAGETPEKSRTGRTRPLIVIDPGHGGIDSGAEGALGLEKDLVLAVAKEIQKALMATRRYDVVMTRSSDVFVSLDERVRISMRQSADLFLSVHADSLAAKELAQYVRGATLYVLSERASDDFARRMAEKENAADLLAGLRLDTTPGDTQVRNILIDLMRREAATQSSDFRAALIAAMRSRIALAREPARSAPFKVLRQPGSPAVLLELGYLSNEKDEQLMGSLAWQRQVATAVTQAVGAYFTRGKGQRP